MPGPFLIRAFGCILAMACAAGGTAFDRAYCMGGMTPAVCVPSRAMLLSGRSLFHIDAQLRGCDTWPERFERAGYRTCITGKWHNGAAAVQRCFSEGDAVFLGGLHDQWSVPTVSFREHGAPTKDAARRTHASEVFGTAVERFVERLGDEPFFAWVSFTAPHDPRQAPEAFRRSAAAIANRPPRAWKRPANEPKK